MLNYVQLGGVIDSREIGRREGFFFRGDLFLEPAEAQCPHFFMQNVFTDRDLKFEKKFWQ